jgi:hypothetical protein
LYRRGTVTAAPLRLMPPPSTNENQRLQRPHTPAPLVSTSLSSPLPSEAICTTTAHTDCDRFRYQRHRVTGFRVPAHPRGSSLHRNRSSAGQESPPGFLPLSILRTHLIYHITQHLFDWQRYSTRKVNTRAQNKSSRRHLHPADNKSKFFLKTRPFEVALRIEQLSQAITPS